jgi:hypothetical protein
VGKGAEHLGRGTSQGLFLEGQKKEARTCDTRKPTMPKSPLYWPTESDTKFGQAIFNFSAATTTAKKDTFIEEVTIDINGHGILTHVTFNLKVIGLGSILLDTTKFPINYPILLRVTRE